MRLTDLPARRPAIAIALVALFSGIALWGAFVERDDRHVTSPRAKAHRDYSEAVARDFGSDGSDVLILVDQFGRGDLFDHESARAFGDLLRNVRALPAVVGAYSYDQISAYGFGLVPRPLFPEPDDSEAKHANCRQRALDHPVVAGNLLSHDARTALVPVLVTAEHRKEARQQIESIRATVQATTEGSPIRARLIGAFPVLLERSDAINYQKKVFLVACFTLAAVLALLLFRSVLTTILIVSPAATGLLWTFGSLGFTFEKLSPLSMIVMPIILITVGVTNAAHIAFQIRRGLGAGLDRPGAVATAMRKLAVPCFLSALTTAAGFASLRFVEADLVNDFGRDCSIGTLLTFCAAILLVPLFALSPLGAHLAKTEPKGSASPWGLAAFFEKLFDRILARAPAVVGVTVLLTGGFAWAASTLRPDIFLNSQLPKGSDSTEAMRHVDQELGGVQVVRLVAEWPEDATAEAVLGVIEQLETLVINEPLLSRSLSIRSVLASLPGLGKDLSRRVHLLDKAPPQTVRSLFRPDLRRAVVVTRVQDLGVAKYAPVYDRLEERLDALGEANPGYGFGLAGSPVGWGRYLHRMVNDLALSLGIAMGIILLIIGIAYRSLRFGLIATLPNLFPLLACSAALAFFKMPLSLPVVCALTICLGIAADDSIHFLSRYRSERASGLKREDALRVAFMRVGHVLAITTTIMLLSLGIILFSNLPMFRAFALVACATLAAALVADLVILPALLKIFGRRDAAPESPPSPSSSAG